MENTQVLLRGETELSRNRWGHRTLVQEKGWKKHSRSRHEGGGTWYLGVKGSNVT